MWAGPEDHESPEFTDEAAARYASLVEAQRAAFVRRTLGDTEADERSGRARLILEPGRYHVGVAVTVDPAEGEQHDYWGGTYINWDNPRHYVCGGLSTPARLRTGSVNRITIDLNDPADVGWPGPYGCVVWSFAAEPFVGESAAMADDGTIYVPARWNLYALDSDGNEQWVFSEGNDVSHPAVADDGTVFVHERGLSNDSTLYSLDPETGTANWSSQTDGTIYVGSDDGRLYAVDAEDGSKNWSFATGDAIEASPLIGPDGTIYIGSRDGRFYALTSSSSGPADAPWPMLGADPQRTGRHPFEEQPVY